MALLAATKDVAPGTPANKLLGTVLSGLGGRGGGTPELAQGGAPEGVDQAKILDALLGALR